MVTFLNFKSNPFFIWKIEESLRILDLIITLSIEASSDVFYEKNRVELVKSEFEISI